MANRTNATLVQTILGVEDYDEERDLTPFIKWANIITNKVASCARAKDDVQDDDTLLEMESWLAAHAYKQSDQALASSSTEGSSGSFQGKTGELGINGTKYGQAALALDFSGCLFKINQGAAQPTAGMDYLGLPPSSQTPYYQRD